MMGAVGAQPAGHRRQVQQGHGTTGMQEKQGRHDRAGRGTDNRGTRAAGAQMMGPGGMDDEGSKSVDDGAGAQTMGPGGMDDRGSESAVDGARAQDDGGSESADEGARGHG